MAIVGYMGDIKFEVTDKTYYTLQNMAWKASARYVTHDRHGGSSISEKVGTGLATITFEITILKNWGKDPQTEIARLFQYERDGVAFPLTLGLKGYGRYRWTITDHDTSLDYFDPQGNVIACSVKLTLLEYLRT